MARKNAVSDMEETEDKFFASGGKEGVQEKQIEEPNAEVSNEPVADESKPERQRGPDGKFLPKEDEPKVEKTETEKQSMVPHGALHEERERRKRIEKEMAETRAAFEVERKRNEERWAHITERLNPKPQAPSVEENAVGHFQHRTQELEQRLAQTQQETAQIRQLNAQQHQWQQFQSAYAHAVTDYASRTPDYIAAHNHFINALKSEIQAIGYDQQQAAHLAMQQETAIVAKAFQDGVNPAERIYAISKMRGYGGQVAPDTKADQEKVERIDQGQRASAATVSGGGKPKMSWQDIAAMSDDEFKKLDWEKAMRGVA